MGFASRRSILNRAAQHGFDAQAVAKIYGFPVANCYNNPVGVIELGGGYLDGDNSAYAAKFGLASPKVSWKGVLGGRNVPGGDPSGADGEVALDIQNILGATGGTAPVVVYFAPNSAEGFVEAVRAASRDSICALSISWGQDEKHWTDSAIAAMRSAIVGCVAAGIPVFCASGDDGSKDGDVGNNVDLPASIPEAIGCGGTTLQSDVPLVESAWSYGGGGYSTKFAKPAWQTGNANPMRGVPDVAGDANPNSGYWVLVDGKPAVIGGTSAVSPMYAALVSLFCSITGKRWGNFGELLYRFQDGFYDITTGSNGEYTARRGWDECTGLGTPNALKIVADLTRTSSPAPVPVPPPVPVPSPVDPTCSELLDLLASLLGKASQKAKRSGR